MPKVTVDGVGEFEVPLGKRLVLALEDEAGIDQLHSCGGLGKCTTCQVTFLDGEPDRMTEKEKETLGVRELTGVRLSCQIPCDHAMTVKAESRLSTHENKKDVGPRPADEIEPPPVWVEK